MHSLLHFIIPYLIGSLLGLGILYMLRRFHWAQELKKLAELNDCPFEFYVRSKNGDNHIVFELGRDLTLWCTYSFGIRSDGVYGVNNIELQGLNGIYGSKLKLKIGQSIFPIIAKMNEFEGWLDPKPFDYTWDKYFAEAWEEMKKRLDNLRYLETKSKEKEKKQK